MLVVQWVLLPLGVMIAIWEFIAFMRTGKRRRLLHAIVWGMFSTAVWNPNLVQQIADIANVGRGTDFVIYGFVVFSLLFAFYVLRVFEQQRRQITQLVRELAIQEQRIRSLTKDSEA